MTDKANLPPFVPAPTLDTSRAEPVLAEFLNSYFEAKSKGDVEGLLHHLSKDVETYSDAPMGWSVRGYEALVQSFTQSLGQVGEGRSYPTSIMGRLANGSGSAVIRVHNTPEIVGCELDMISTVDIQGGGIVRIVDYWDSTSFDDQLFAEKVSDERPTEYLEDRVGQNASAVLFKAAERLQSALAVGDVSQATSLFDDDAVVEDLSLRIQIVGKASISRYLSRVVDSAPFGLGARLRHIVGGDAGGAFEWVGSSHTQVEGGVTRVELTPSGLTSRMTTVYDSRQLEPAARRTFVLISTGA